MTDRFILDDAAKLGSYYIYSENTPQLAAGTRRWGIPKGERLHTSSHDLNFDFTFWGQCKITINSPALISFGCVLFFTHQWFGFMIGFFRVGILSGNCASASSASNI